MWYIRLSCSSGDTLEMAELEDRKVSATFCSAHGLA